MAELERASGAWQERGWPRPAMHLVSGSGLAVDLGEPTHGPIPLAELLPFEVEGVAGHPLTVELLEPVPGRVVLYQRGRLHAYQGLPVHRTVLPVRLAAALGARVLLMTNAAGALGPGHSPGDLLLLSDHLNLTGLDPLRGRLPEAWGPRFPDMSGAYDAALGRRVRQVAAELGIELGEGVYAGVGGPCYETPTEVRMLAALGADVVGMSTVLEVAAAHPMGVRCAVVSLVTNPAAGVGGGTLDHREVLEAGRAAAERLRRLLAALLADPHLVPDVPRAGRTGAC